jgi:hypothetical protein
VNIAYATIEALKSMVPRDQWVNAPANKPKAKTKGDEK